MDIQYFWKIFSLFLFLNDVNIRTSFVRRGPYVVLVESIQIWAGISISSYREQTVRDGSSSILSMVLILDGSSEHGEHIWSNSVMQICWMHLLTSIGLTNRRWPLLLYKCATCSELPDQVFRFVEGIWLHWSNQIFFSEMDIFTL